jgi:hypothetical protein
MIQVLVGTVGGGKGISLQWFSSTELNDQLMGFFIIYYFDSIFC